MEVVRGIMDALLRPISSKHDTPEVQQKKKIMLCLMLVFLPTAIGFVASDEHKSIAYAIATRAGIIACVGTYVGWCVFPHAPMELFFLFCLLTGIMFGDMYTSAEGDRMWSWAVLVMDAGVVLNLPKRYSGVMLASVCVYLLAIGVDRMSYGAYRELSPKSVPWVYDCASPPCLQPWDSAATDMFISVVVFLLDFYLTQGFATAMRHQNDLVMRAIEATEAIAQLLSSYEVEEGRALLEGEQGRKLPGGLEKAMSKLLDNLDQYRPYLPDTLLVREESAGEAAAVEPPGLGQSAPTVTLCFTDIQSSTELWEMYPQGMHSSLQLHNSAVRKAAKENGGYEVKVIGDAFMLAFKSAEDGCRFGLAVQVALTEVKWPSDLLQHPLCRPVAADEGGWLWNGPRVRVGVHCGTVRVEKNPVTGRCDYFGPSVNTAARVESCLQQGGLTGVTNAVLDQLSVGWMVDQSPMTVKLGTQQLKGVSAGVDVTLLMVRQLAARQDVLSNEPPPPTLTLQKPAADNRSPSEVSSAPEVMPGVRDSTRTSSLLTGPRIREGLHQRTASCVCFRTFGCAELAALGMAVEDMLEVVEMAADITQGVVAGAVSVQCTVVWNGPRACTDHYGQGLRAVDCVQRSQRGTQIAQGATSGQILYGHLAAGRRKYSVVVGGCVELAAVLAAAAEEGRQAALAAGTFAMYCASLKRSRRYAEWDVADSVQRLSVVSVTAPSASESRWESADEMSLCASGTTENSVRFPDAAGSDRHVVVGLGVLPQDSTSGSLATVMLQ